MTISTSSELSSKSNQNKENDIGVRRREERYINMKESLHTSLKPTTYVIYTHLRFKADYSEEHSVVKISIASICSATGLGKTVTHEALNEMESAGLILRIINPGFITTYDVAQTLGFFARENDQNERMSAEEKPKKLSTITCEPLRIPNTPLRIPNTPPPESGYDPLSSSINSLNSKTPSVDNSFDEVRLRDSLFSEHDKDFMKLMEIYPRPEKQNDAWEEWKSLNPDRETKEKIFRDIPIRRRDDIGWRDLKFVHYPSRYLKEKMWLKKIVTAKDRSPAANHVRCTVPDFVSPPKQSTKDKSLLEQHFIEMRKSLRGIAL